MYYHLKSPMKKYILLALSVFLLMSLRSQAQNTCAAPQVIGSLPFTATGQTTAGTGDDYDNTHACNNNYMNGDDFIYSYTPAGNECVNIQLTNTGACTGLFVYDACPDLGGTTCMASAIGQDPQVGGLSFTAATTYYIMISSDPATCSQTTAFDIGIQSITAGGTGSVCAVAQNLGALPYTQIGFTNCCSGNDYDNTMACTSTYMMGEDYVFSYTSAGNECISVDITNTVPSNVDFGVFITDLCPDAVGVTCINSETESNGGPSVGATLTAAGTYYITVATRSNPPCGSADIRITSSPIGTIGSTCANPDVIPSLPFTSTGLSTCCAGDDYDDTHACGSVYMNGEDYIFAYTTAGNECLDIAITNVQESADMGVFVYDGCPDLGGTVCLGQATAFNSGPSLGTTLSAAGTYYIMVSTTTNPNCSPFDIAITSVAAGAVGSNCANPDDILALPFSRTTETTKCLANDYTNASLGSCGTAYETGEDKVYRYVKTSSNSECINISLSNTTDNNVGYTIYDGCPDLGTTNCVGSAGPAVGGNLSGTVILQNAATYYIVVDAAVASFDYDIDVTSNGPGQPNDLPCNASALTLGTIVFGDNDCSDDASEPAAPACWSAGTRNTVWYSVVCPASGEISVKTFSGTLLNTQIALYSGVCGASLVEVACNDDYTFCSNAQVTSEIVATGLTPGNTYYIAVDGNQNTTGIFSIVAIDGTTSYPVSTGQDCSVTQAITACNQVMTVGNPGFTGTGNTCDFSGAGNCTTGELNSAWYTIDIATNGTLSFAIIPNDATNASCGGETDYDFVLWKVSGVGATNCAAITSSGGGASVACNYSFLGVTGANGAGTAPAPFNACFDGAFQPAPTVVAGEQYILCVQNFSGNSSGFSLDFSNTPVGVVNYVPPTSVTWGGATSTQWDLSANWGNCVFPSCATDAVIASGPTSQPIVTGTMDVRNVTINAGATLTLGAGATLNVCGDFICLGNLVCDPTSTIIFNDPTNVQVINGNLTGANRLGNLTINKTGGEVQLNTILEVGGDFTTMNGTSVFNSQGRYMILSGDFNNAGAGVTYPGPGTTGTLEFNGAAVQQYNPGGALVLNDVVVNNSATGVNLNENMILGTTGDLTLLQGNIVTGANRVEAQNTAGGAVTAGGPNSFVLGNLRRYINPVGGYDFPVGDAVVGYQRVNLEFTAVTAITYLDCRFDQYGAVPPALGPTECGFTYNYPALDMGQWTLTPDANGNTGVYDCTLFPTNYTNPASDFWTVMRSNGTWGLVNGICDPSSTVNIVRRLNMDGFSFFGVAQSNTSLPVDLISFEGEHRIDHNFLEWETAEELNSDYFAIERSTDNEHFEELDRVNAAGNTTAKEYYSYRDRFLEKNLYYYRLKQVDQNGEYVYSNTVALRADNSLEGLSGLYPNPARTSVYLDVTSLKDAVLQFELMDVSGKALKSWEESILAGSTTIETSVADLPDGIYLFKVTAPGSDFNRVYKLVRQE